MAKATDIHGLDCEARADEGARLVLCARLEEMCALRSGALDWSDIRGVHAMRVASRRLRSALRDFQPLLPKAVPRRRLKAIAAALGAVRDMDVAIAELDRLQAKAEEGVAEEIEQLAAEHRSRRDEARTCLEEAITEEVLNGLREKFIARLDENPKHKDKKGKHGKRDGSRQTSFREFGHQLILSRFDELQQLSRSLYQPFETEPLHRMRIAAKRLRYAMELFSPCWPGLIAPFAGEVAGLQKSLGELHDYDLWIAGLGKRLDRLHLEENGYEEVASSSEAEAADSNTPQQRAVIWLFRHFVKERIRHFRAALARWHKWETTDFLSRLNTILAAAPAATDTKPETSDASAAADSSDHDEPETASAVSAE